MEALERTIAYTFRDRDLLETALTHSSYANEHGCASNERLEFVGDSVLGLVTASELYARFPDMPEGKMTRLRAELVCEQSLWEVAETLELGRRLRLGRGEESSGGRTRHSILADCVEALIAAMYLDGGMAPAARFIGDHVLSKLSEGPAALSRDWKTELQELIQRKPGRVLSYAMTGESGPDHRKRFTAAVSMNGTVIGAGEGCTKKEAEQAAARAALEAMEREATNHTK
jgi:ribonuclease-3